MEAKLKNFEGNKKIIIENKKEQNKRSDDFSSNYDHSYL
jgi:hypothetical protein